MGKTIRFGDLVRNSGRPQTVTLWTTPEHNPALTHAIKQNRVLTVVQEAGRKDRGLVGFRSLPGALYLIFPKALPEEPDASVIGINYQLISPILRPVVACAGTGSLDKFSHLKRNFKSNPKA